MIKSLTMRYVAYSFPIVYLQKKNNRIRGATNKIKKKNRKEIFPASILRKSTSGRHRPVSYTDGPMTARYRFT